MLFALPTTIVRRVLVGNEPCTLPVPKPSNKRIRCLRGGSSNQYDRQQTSRLNFILAKNSNLGPFLSVCELLENISSDTQQQQQILERDLPYTINSAMMEPSYHPQPHKDDDVASNNNDNNIIAATSSFDSYEQAQQISEEPKPRISPRAQRRISPWAMDLQLKRGTGSNRPSSKTERSTSSWKMRMQQRKAVYGGVAVAEEDEEDAATGLLEQPSLDHEDNGPTPQQKALRYIQEQRKQKQLEAKEREEASSVNSGSNTSDNGLRMLEDSILEEEDEEEEEMEEHEPATAVSLTNVEDDHVVVEELEVLRQRVIVELKQALERLYIGDQYIVESFSDRQLTQAELWHYKNRHQQVCEFDTEKKDVMKDLAQRISGIYTHDHHVVEAMSKLEEIINQDSLEEEEEKKEKDEKDEMGQAPTMPQQPQPTFQDLPRANFHFHGPEEDEISVFTEVTIEDMVHAVIPNDDLDDTKQSAFKDQMRKSFLAFEQLVHAKHQMEVEDYDEETVFEEYSIVQDDSKTVMTEMTTEELVEQVVVQSLAKQQATGGAKEEEPSKDSLETFQSEMRKSFAAFEALLGDNELDEEEEATTTVVHNDDDDGETVDESSFDEFTVEETVAGSAAAASMAKPPPPIERDASYDEITVAESIIAELAGVVQESPKRTPAPMKPVDKSSQEQQQQRKEEQLKQFQNDMKKSFTAFESLLLRQKEDDDDDDSHNSDEYTVEEVIDQVTAGDDSKLFAKEMQKSFLAFESLLKQTNESSTKEDESVWEEETVQDTIVQQGSVMTPATPKITAYNNTPTLTGRDASIMQSPNRSVASGQSGKTYEDAISLVDGASSRASGSKYDDAIQLLDAEEEKEETKTCTTGPMTPSRHAAAVAGEEEEEEKKDDAMGGTFDKGGDNTENTEQETLSGDTKPETANNTSAPNSLPSSPAKRSNTSGPVLVLTKPEPKTPSPTKKFTHRGDVPLEVNALTNSRMFSDTGLVLPSSETKKSKVKSSPQKKNLPIMDVEFNDGGYDDDDDMTQITFDHTMIHETPQKQRPPTPREEEGSPGPHDETGSTCSSQASKGIAEMLRRDIWSPDLLVVQTALEKLGMEAVKGRSYRSHIVKFGGLLGILRAMDMNPTHSGIQLAACQALERLALDPETQMSIGGVGGIPVVATAMQNNASNVEIQQAATAALVNISCCPQENIEGVLESVILSMTKHANDTEVQENSFKVLANLTMDSPGRLKELSQRGGLAAMTMALQKPWSIKAEHHEAISLLSMLLRNLAECNQ